MQSGKKRLCWPITSAKSSVLFGHATKAAKNPCLTYVFSHTPSLKLPRFKRLSLVTRAVAEAAPRCHVLLLPFLKFLLLHGPHVSRSAKVGPPWVVS